MYYNVFGHIYHIGTFFPKVRGPDKYFSFRTVAKLPTPGIQHLVCVIQMKNRLQKCKEKWNKNLFTV